MDIKEYGQELINAKNNLVKAREDFKIAQQKTALANAQELLNTDWNVINEERSIKGLTKISNAEQRKAYMTELNNERDMRITELEVAYRNAQTTYDTLTKIIKIYLATIAEESDES